jgi:hypothetical protein
MTVVMREIPCMMTLMLVGMSKIRCGILADEAPDERDAVRDEAHDRRHERGSMRDSDGSSNAVDGTSGDDGSGDGASTSDPGAGSGDGSSGSDCGGTSDGSGDDSSGDDSTDAVRHPRLKAPHRRRRDALGLATTPAPVVAADANGCYSCTLTCVVASAPPGAANAGTAVGASNVDPDAACGDAKAELSSWAHDQGTSLQACRLGSAPAASPPAAGQGAAPASAPPAMRSAPPQLLPSNEARFR